MAQTKPDRFGTYENLAATARRYAAFRAWLCSLLGCPYDSCYTIGAEYVWIDGVARPVNTEEQQTAAARMLSEAGLNSEIVYRNGKATHLVLLADSDVDPVANGTKVG